MLGDGTGAGKGRQSAGIILDNWLQGRRKAVWISKSDKLLEDAQRDWSALGMERLLVTPLSRFPQGTSIRLNEGVLFTTYATLRSDDRGEKLSRVKQLVEWLGSDFDGVIIFDESHAMQNAGGGKGERGDVAPSQQGRAGLSVSVDAAKAPATIGPQLTADDEDSIEAGASIEDSVVAMTSSYRMNSASRMMMGIGTPSSQSRRPRPLMVASRRSFR